MRILEKGIHPDEIVCTGRCSTCKTKVEFTRGEAKRNCDYRETTYSVQCPCCKGIIYASSYGGGGSMWEDR